MGGSLLVARIAHAVGSYEKKTPNAGRFMGTAITWAVVVTAAAYALYLRF